ncbi:MAG: plasmid mobilization protein [Gemmatimonadaceae bacterium]
MAKRKRTGGAVTKQRKDDVIRVRVTAEQKQALVSRAERDGLELSAWTRQQIFRAAGLLPAETEPDEPAATSARSEHK